MFGAWFYKHLVPLGPKTRAIKELTDFISAENFGDTTLELPSIPCLGSIEGRRNKLEAIDGRNLDAKGAQPFERWVGSGRQIR